MAIAFKSYSPSNSFIGTETIKFKPYALPTTVKSLEDSTWAEISAISAAGTWDEQGWQVGDTKTIVLNGTVGSVELNNYQCKVYILEFNHNSTREGAGISFGMLENIDGKQLCLVDSNYYNGTSDNTAFTMNTDNIDTGGWKNCHMRKTILGSTDVENGDATSAAITNPQSNSFMSVLPSDLRSVLKPINKYYDNSGTLSENMYTKSVDYLPLMSDYEITGKASSYTMIQENIPKFQKQYQYFKDGNSSIKYQYNDTSSGRSYWTSAVAYGFGTGFQEINSEGKINGFMSANVSLGISPIFLV